MHPKILLPHARLLVEKYGAVVVAPEYRTAFEKPFPADLEDCYAALLFLKVHADELGINDAQIMVGGESAGGGLTVATCLLARDIGEVNIAFQMPLYPMLDDRETASSRDNHAPVWNTRTNRFAWKYYLRGLGGVTPPCYAAPPARPIMRACPLPTPMSALKSRSIARRLSTSRTSNAQAQRLP